jgi:hypothetical protein
MPEITAQKFKERQLRTLPRTTGVYALCDLDNVPVYVGKSVDAIRDRVRRHLTSARSDVIANRQIDVWEIAYVRAWSIEGSEAIKAFERRLYTAYDRESPLVNGDVLSSDESTPGTFPEPIQVQVMPDELVRARKDPSLRFPRQIQHFNQLVDYILNTQDKPHLRRALQVYFDRLSRYYGEFVGGPHPTTTTSQRQRRRRA